MSVDLAKEVIKMHNAMKSLRVNWDSHWQEVADYVMPRKNDVFGVQVKGEKKNNNLYDGTAIQANELLASALHGMLTNPATQWFELTTGIPEIDNISRVRRWMQAAARKMVAVMNQSNFQTEIHEVYLDLGAFGTAALRIEEDPDMIVRFSARPLYEHYIDENYKGLVDKLSIDRPIKSRNILQQYDMKFVAKRGGIEVASKIEQFKRDPDKEWTVIRLILPRKEANKFPDVGRIRKPFYSVHVVQDLNMVIKEEGFNEFPYAVARWTKTSDEVYGRGPGIKALPDTKMLNQIMKTTLRGAQKTVDPVLQAPDDGIILPLRTVPGGINYYRAGTQDRIEPLQTNARIDFGQALMDDVRARIRQMFFIDQLQLNEGPQMTATEVLQRTEEKLRLMGPVLGRQHFELLQPLINRVFGIMARKNQLPADPPPELQDIDLDVKFSSMIARAQTASEADNIQRVIGLVAPIAQTDPTLMDNIDGDKYLRFASKLFNVPEEIFRTEQEVQELREQRAQAQQQQAEMLMQQQQAETLDKAASASSKLG